MTTIEPITPTTAAPPVPLGPNRWATIRPIESGDRDRLFDFYRRLSPRSRASRFLAATSGIGLQAADEFAHADHRHRDGLVAVLRDAGPDDGAIIGHLCLEPDPSRDGAEELAIAVADGFQGQGIGSALMAAALASANERGVRRLTASLLPTNRPMRELLLDTGLPVERDRVEYGVEQIELALGMIGRSFRQSSAARKLARLAPAAPAPAPRPGPAPARPG